MFKSLSLSLSPRTRGHIASGKCPTPDSGSCTLDLTSRARIRLKTVNVSVFVCVKGGQGLNGFAAASRGLVADTVTAAMECPSRCDTDQRGGAERVLYAWGYAVLVMKERAKNERESVCVFYEGGKLGKQGKRGNGKDIKNGKLIWATSV